MWPLCITTIVWPLCDSLYPAAAVSADCDRGAGSAPATNAARLSRACSMIPPPGVLERGLIEHARAAKVPQNPASGGAWPRRVSAVRLVQFQVVRSILAAAQSTPAGVT